MTLSKQFITSLRQCPYGMVRMVILNSVYKQSLSAGFFYFIFFILNLISIFFIVKNELKLPFNYRYNYDTWINLQVNNTIEQILDFTEVSGDYICFYLL